MSPANMENAFHAYNHSILMLVRCAAISNNSFGDVPSQVWLLPEVYCLVIAQVIQLILDDASCILCCIHREAAA